jgi:hypothetical protein
MGGDKMGKHSGKGTASNSDTHAGGNKMGKHEIKHGQKQDERAPEIIKRLHTRKGGDISSMDTGQ